ncbi:unnamed protein product [Meloidogyne enterolobii]|uniref:Uncharacterized protein n=1 Tax=Meloidogyne enterolobii TaxID=390850 RepID=A0ACB0XXA6_MELEN
MAASSPCVAGYLASVLLRVLLQYAIALIFSPFFCISAPAQAIFEASVYRIKGYL